MALVDFTVRSSAPPLGLVLDNKRRTVTLHRGGARGGSLNPAASLRINNEPVNIQPIIFLHPVRNHYREKAERVLSLILRHSRYSNPRRMTLLTHGVTLSIKMRKRHRTTQLSQSQSCSERILTPTLEAPYDALTVSVRAFPVHGVPPQQKPHLFVRRNKHVIVETDAGLRHLNKKPQPYRVIVPARSVDVIRHPSQNSPTKRPLRQKPFTIDGPAPSRSHEVWL